MLVNPESVTVENEHCSLPYHLVDNHQKHIFDAKPDFNYLAHAKHFDVTFCFPFVPALRFIYELFFAFILIDENVRFADTLAFRNKDSDSFFGKCNIHCNKDWC